MNEACACKAQFSWLESSNFLHLLQKRLDMITFSGKNFDPENPQPDQIDLLDIAVALSRVNRFVGHTVFTYSVAQHSLYVADLMVPRAWYITPKEKRLKLFGLMHDMDEAYTSDIPSPIKQFLKPSIIEVENRIMDAIYQHFKILPPTSEEKKLVKEMDNISYDLEDQALRGRSVFELTYVPGGQPQQVNSDLVALVFMKEFNRLMEP